MIFVINNLKYDTDHMELISMRCKQSYTMFLFGDSIKMWASDTCLWKSKKNNWLLTYEKNNGTITCGVALTEEEVKEKLMRYDLEAYEKLFGELEEA